MLVNWSWKWTGLSQYKKLLRQTIPEKIFENKTEKSKKDWTRKGVFLTAICKV